MIGDVAIRLAELVRQVASGATTLEIVDTGATGTPTPQPELARLLADTVPTIDLRRGMSLALV